VIESIRCEGYKAFNLPLEIRLRPITVFFGKNNSGKTTLARLPIAIISGLINPNTFYSTFANGISFGSSFTEIANAGNPHPAIFYGLTWSEQRSLSVRLQHISTSEGRDRVQPIYVEIDGHDETFQLDEPMTSTARSMVEQRMPAAAKQALGRNIESLEILLDSFLHIASSRPKVRTLYEARPASGWSVEEVPYQLQSNSSLLQMVDRWYQNYLDGAGVDIDQAAFAFKLIEQHGDIAVNFAQSGRGPQSAIAVVTLLSAVANGNKDASLVVIEEPEAHLHPSVHGDVADLTVAASLNSQLIIETHSENFLLRLRRRIAEKILSPSQLALYFVDESHRVSEVPLDEFGTTSHWPVGVFESDIEEARAIIDARLAAISDRGDAL
jgi:hypothetical protein